MWGVLAVASLTPLPIWSRPACFGSSESRVCCKPDGNTMEMRACASQDFSVADRELNTTYKAVMRALSPDAQTALRIEQRGWLKKLEPDCIADVGDPATSGTIWPQEFTECKTQATKKRTQELRARNAMRQ
ncbi:lysozyme inhibitor LprI family protein [Variovorax rhizosphaerae]|uniref:Lysozyme inhibitor LprI family protein n=1 Tax=Variovorax rhizosphaerae TaxID=1836200 RepID=A0ABU8WJ23_9BURK